MRVQVPVKDEDGLPLRCYFCGCFTDTSAGPCEVCKPRVDATFNPKEQPMDTAEEINYLRELREQVEAIGPLSIVRRGDAARTFFITQDTDTTALHSRFLLECRDVGSGRDLTDQQRRDLETMIVGSTRFMRRLLAMLDDERAEVRRLREELRDLELQYKDDLQRLDDQP